MATPSNGFSLVAAMRMCLYSACIGQQYKAVCCLAWIHRAAPRKGVAYPSHGRTGSWTRQDTPVLHPERGRRILAGPGHTELI